MDFIFKIYGFILYNLHRFNTIALGRYLSSKINGGGSGRVTGEVSLSYLNNISIGENSFVNGGQLAAGPNSKIIIGNNVMISYGVHIRTQYHNYKNRDIPMCKQGMSEKDIIIEDNCWIGHSAHIMSGVTIHTGSVVGANAVVTRDVEPNTVVAGVPARVIAKL